MPTAKNTNPWTKILAEYRKMQANDAASLPFPRKAVFIDFGAGQVRLLGNKRYEIVYNMQIHVVDDIVSETSKMEARARAGVATPEYAVDQALARLDLIDHILYHLTGFTTTGMSGMQCTVLN